MKRNILLVTIAILIVTLIIAGTSFAVGKYTATKAANFEELHENCVKNPDMQKMMEKIHGKDWKKHRDEMKGHVKDGKGMMGGSSMM